MKDIDAYAGLALLVLFNVAVYYGLCKVSGFFIRRNQRKQQEKHSS